MKPKFLTERINQPQTTSNIAKMVVRAVNSSREATEEIAHKFDGQTIYDVCYNIYEFCRSQMPYQREGAGRQRAMEIPVIVHNLGKRIFDCKHYATFSKSILDALGIPCQLKMISQDFYNKDPKHIYVVAFDNGKEIIVDPCMSKFDDEPRYNYRYSINFNTKKP